MKNANEYYKKTMNNKPSGLVRSFFDFKYNEMFEGNTAIDLGCGAGNDTEFLISKGFQVTAVDNQEAVKDKFEEKNFDMKYFSEEKYYKDTALGKNKFWHVYTVMGEKK